MCHALPFSARDIGGFCYAGASAPAPRPLRPSAPDPFGRGRQSPRALPRAMSASTSRVAFAGARLTRGARARGSRRPSPGRPLATRSSAAALDEAAPPTPSCFVDHCGVFAAREGAPGGPLSGLTFSAKDNLDVAGVRTGCGSPRWLETSGSTPASSNAVAVEAMLDAGATLVGKTHMDELAWALTGENAHYGTPPTRRARARSGRVELGRGRVRRERRVRRSARDGHRWVGPSSRELLRRLRVSTEHRRRVQRRVRPARRLVRRRRVLREGRRDAREGGERPARHERRRGGRNDAETSTRERFIGAGRGFVGSDVQRGVAYVGSPAREADGASARRTTVSPRNEGALSVRRRGGRVRGVRARDARGAVRSAAPRGNLRPSDGEDDVRVRARRGGAPGRNDESRERLGGRRRRPRDDRRGAPPERVVVLVPRRAVPRGLGGARRVGSIERRPGLVRARRARSLRGGVGDGRGRGGGGGVDAGRPSRPASRPSWTTASSSSSRPRRGPRRGPRASRAGQKRRRRRTATRSSG